jgi:copper transport protein
VTWRVISADSHPVRGAFTFTVGTGTPASSDVVAQLFNEGSDRVWEVLGAIARGLAYGGTLLAAGGALFLAVAHDGAADRRRLRPAVTAGAIVGAIGVLAQIPLSAALATGLGLTAITESGVLKQVLGDGVGLSTAGTLIGLAIVVVAVRGQQSQRGRVAAIAGAVVATASFALAGHTTTTSPKWLVITTDAAHVVAGAAWLGGMVLLGLLLRFRRAGAEPAVPAGAVVARFSTLAAGSLAVVAVAGGVLSWSEVRTLHALTSTTYGWLLIAKVAVVAVIALIGGYNRFRLVPALIAAEQKGRNAWSHLRRTVGIEVVGFVVVVGITAVLVNVTPARTAAGLGTIYSKTQAIGGDSVNLVVDPARAGSNAIHLYLLDRTGRPAALAEELHLELSLPANDIGPIVRTPSVAGPGHYQLDTDDLSIAGKWDIAVVARFSKFEEERTTFHVTVNP